MTVFLVDSIVGRKTAMAEKLECQHHKTDADEEPAVKSSLQKTKSIKLLVKSTELCTQHFILQQNGHMSALHRVQVTFLDSI